MTRSIAIIPARGGSKRIPHKNLQLIGGTTLVGWTARECARAFGAENVFVSTDDPAILREALRHGVKTLPRSAALAGDNVTSEAVMVDALEQINTGPDDVALMVQCTSPFTTTFELRQAAAVADLDYRPTTWAARERWEYAWEQQGEHWYEANHSANVDRDGKCRVRRPIVVETGAFYARTVEHWVANRTRFMGTVCEPIMVAHPVDIDTADDLANARWMYARCRELHEMNAPRARIKLLAFDVDGVLTSGHVGVCEGYPEAMSFSRRDGASMRRMMANGVDVVWFTAEPEGGPAFARARKLGIECYSLAPSERLPWLTRYGVPLANVAYVGDSQSDAEILSAVGAGFAPETAQADALMAARYFVGSGGWHVAEHVEEILGWSALDAGGS